MEAIKPLSFKISPPGCKPMYGTAYEIFPLGISDFNRGKFKFSFIGRGLSKKEKEPLIRKKEIFKRYDFEINPSNDINSFCLVEGGWIPFQISNYTNILIDRCVMAKIESHSFESSEYRENMKLMANTEGLIISSIFSVIEKDGKFPHSFHEYISRFSEDYSHIKNFFNKMSKLPPFYVDLSYENIFKYINEYNMSRECDFLIEASGHILNKVSRKERLKLSYVIIDVAEKYGVSRKSITLSLVISCIFELDDSFSRRVLKPNEIFKGSNPMNCIYDILFLELVILIKKVKNDKFSGLTFDKGLAKLWCALGLKINNTDNDMIYTIAITNKLFPSATPTELKELKKILS